MLNPHEMTPHECYTHACSIKKRWPEGERRILTDPARSYCYACDVIKGRWHEGEKVILTDPYLSYAYARDVIKGRWPEAEKTLMQSVLWDCYVKDIFNGDEAIAEIIKCLNK